MPSLPAIAKFALLILLVGVLMVWEGCSVSKSGRRETGIRSVQAVRDDGRPLPALFTDTTAIDTSVASPEDCAGYADSTVAWERYPELRTRVVAKMPAGTHLDSPMFVRVYVDRKGYVRRARIMQGESDPAVNRAVLRSVLQYRFTPARLNNVPAGACKWIAVHDEEPPAKKR